MKGRWFWYNTSFFLQDLRISRFCVFLESRITVSKNFFRFCIIICNLVYFEYYGIIKFFLFWYINYRKNNWLLFWNSILANIFTIFAIIFNFTMLANITTTTILAIASLSSMMTNTGTTTIFTFASLSSMRTNTGTTTILALDFEFFMRTYVTSTQGLHWFFSLICSHLYLSEDISIICIIIL